MPSALAAKVGRQLAVAIFAALLLSASVPVATAQPDDPVLDAVQATHDDRRLAIVALHRGDIGRASQALARVERRWRHDVAQVPRIRRELEPGLAIALARLDALLALAGSRVTQGDREGAAAALERVEDALQPWRAARSRPLLADCLAGFARAWERVYVGAMAAHKPARNELTEAAFAAEQSLARCRTDAANHLRHDAEFRAWADRLADSLQRLQQALTNDSPALIERLLREQRMLERMLGQRYG